MDTAVFFQSDPLPSNSFNSFDYARGNESIFYFTHLCKPIETYIYARKKHPFSSYPEAKQTQQTCGYKHTTKTSEPFLFRRTGVDFSFRNNFKTSGSFPKVSIPGKIYNSLM